ncbi:MAG TPA: AMP-binding protein, partial [Pyrinomonadaceae bacterium]|nr:AMP-binding protein [Pyrinomonadaceae bacterium]
MSAQSSNIESVLHEDRSFEPPEIFSRSAHVRSAEEYERLRAEARESPETYWARVAEELRWFRKWDEVLRWESPHAQWFTGGKINIADNCLDRHLETWRKNKAAIIWEGEPGEVRTLTYAQLHREVCRFANVLKRLGVEKGDRVALYMPMIPELAVAMLACARIGAPHSIVFGGFSSDSLRDRINDAGCKAVVTADGGWRRGQIVQLKQMADEALKDTPSIKSVVLVQRMPDMAMQVHVKEGRDHWYHRL